MEWNGMGWDENGTETCKCNDDEQWKRGSKSTSEENERHSSNNKESLRVSLEGPAIPARSFSLIIVHFMELQILRRDEAHAALVRGVWLTCASTC